MMLDIRDLTVSYRTRTGPVPAVRNLTLTVAAGEAVALVGESGSGKSATAFAVMGLLPDTARVEGSVRLADRELLGLSDRELSAVRGRQVAMVHQDPLAALTPVIPVGRQVAEAIAVHQPGLRRRDATERAVELLDRVGIAAARRRAGALPHEFSGGMRQRVAIAMAIANDPDLIIADEPTSALDTTVQAQILDLLDDVRARTGAALLLITHDLGVVARSCDRIAVLRRGELVEQGPVTKRFRRPASAHLRDLLTASGAEPPTAVAQVTAAGAGPLAAAVRAAASDVGPTASEVEQAEPGAGAALRITGLRRHFPVRRRAVVRAVDGVDLTVDTGEAVALIGESGCGKTTVLREIIALRRPQEGTIALFGADVSGLRRRDRTALRGQVQMVMQDPASSLNPTMSVADVVAEPLRVHGWSRPDSRSRAREVLGLVGLSDEHAGRRPGQLSGGQRQRVAIARALAPGPRLVLLDEPVSALDTSLRVGIMDLLADLRERFGLAFLMTSHDLTLLRRTVDRVTVMYAGRVVETGPAADVLYAPAHPYTRALVAATPVADVAAARAGRGSAPAGEPPDPLDRPDGCAFRRRCPLHRELSAPDRARCGQVPLLAPVDRRQVACHHTDHALGGLGTHPAVEGHPAR
ncbi:ABC transporter ATP-binding protein [Micromonospora sp. CNB394]|uniref:dipeptide ABC transporter ATP-binding protein n=1 Tax=Micromonospora sp. CNB394 TaxID=1169151 RepID=UPI00037CF736|nr:ABC transporter ATP-binding protein [Micromonospora sp. CNB394]